MKVRHLPDIRREKYKERRCRKREEGAFRIVVDNLVITRAAQAAPPKGKRGLNEGRRGVLYTHRLMGGLLFATTPSPVKEKRLPPISTNREEKKA